MGGVFSMLNMPRRLPSRTSPALLHRDRSETALAYVWLPLHRHPKVKGHRMWSAGACSRCLPSGLAPDVLLLALASGAIPPFYLR